MARKLETWITDIFPGATKVYENYRDLPARELVIVVATSFDIALVDLLYLRMKGDTKEVEEFLGINGDGRAPCGSFGARIQLALLLGVITAEDAKLLRIVKSIRNTFAHRVHASFNKEPALKDTYKLFDQLKEQSTRLIKLGLLNGTGTEIQDEPIRPLLDKTPAIGEGIYIAIAAIYTAYFHRLHDEVTPIVQMVIENRV